MSKTLPNSRSTASLSEILRKSMPVSARPWPAPTGLRPAVRMWLRVLISLSQPARSARLSWPPLRRRSWFRLAIRQSFAISPSRAASPDGQKRRRCPSRSGRRRRRVAWRATIWPMPSIRWSLAAWMLPRQSSWPAPRHALPSARTPTPAIRRSWFWHCARPALLTPKALNAPWVPCPSLATRAVSKPRTWPSSSRA